MKRLRNKTRSLDSRFLATRHTATSKAVHQTPFRRGGRGGKGSGYARLAYPLSIRTLTPFRNTGNLCEKVKNYNFVHSTTRIVIEQAFAALKGRFRRLKYIDMDSASVITDVLTACTFHNVCIFGEDNLEDFIEDIEEDSR